MSLSVSESTLLDFDTEFMVKIDLSILNISLPDIARYFGATTSQVPQFSLVYMIVLTSTLLLFGKLADNWGVKKLFI